MRSIILPARAGVLVIVLVLSGCGASSQSADATSASSPTTPASSTSATPEPAEPSNSQSTPTGWERVEIEDQGFAIALPPGWEVADLTSGDIEEMLDVLGDDPQLQAFGEQLPNLVASGIALWAISLDAETVRTGFATNLNALVEDNMTMSLDVYAAANVSFVENTFGVEVQQESIHLPAGDARRLEYEPTVQPVGNYHVTQYLLMGHDRALIATFSRAAGDQFDQLDADFLDIMETVSFLP